MIEIKVYGTVREVRAELLDLLGGTTLSVPAPDEREVAPDAAPEAPKRERGKPSAGRARRTKEEIAEDEAADAADAARGNISTAPENRVDPAHPQDDEETQAQDAEDEQAEVKATAKPDLTHDDIRSALQRYVKAYGMAAAMEDGPKVISKLFGADKQKVSDVPETQEAIAATIAGIEEMLEKNPFDRSANL